MQILYLNLLMYIPLNKIILNLGMTMVVAFMTMKFMLHLTIITNIKSRFFQAIRSS